MKLFLLLTFFAFFCFSKPAAANAISDLAEISANFERKISIKLKASIKRNIHKIVYGSDSLGFLRVNHGVRPSLE